MKTTFQLKIYAPETFFPKERIESKIQVIKILLEASRYILSNYNEKKDSITEFPRLILYKSKMSRLFFVNDLKMYSIRFPFNITINDNNEINMYFYGVDIDSYKISKIMEILNSPSLLSENCLDFIDPISEVENEYWGIIRELFLMEDGYIRYDKDQKGFDEAKNNNKEHKHPLNHLDVFYSNQNTFKIGLKNDIMDSDFIDILNRETDCRYI